MRSTIGEVWAWLGEVSSSRPVRALLVLVVLLGWARSPAATALLLLAAGIGVGVGWVRRRYDLAAQVGADKPTPRELVAGWWLEVRRRGELLRWASACRINGLVIKPVKKPARLFHVQGTLAGDLTARFAGGRVGVYPEDVQAHASQIAQTIGCKEVVVRKTAPGCAELTFLWSEPLERTLPVAETVLGPKGTVTYGTRRDGSPATIQLGLSALIAGMTGAGKSGLCWSLFANLNRVGYRYGLKYDLWISDAKGGTELTPFADKVDGLRRGPVLVRGYAKDVPQTAKLVDQFYAEMKARQDSQSFRKWTINQSADFPLLILFIDEMYELAMMLPKPSKDKLGVVLSQIRSAGGMVIMCTQQAQKEVIGSMRDQYPQRLSLAQPDALATTMALGNNAEPLGARCSQIPVHQPGLGYSFDHRHRGFEPFRAGWCNDRDIARIAAGKLPKGMPVRVDQWCVYRFFDSVGALLYVGFTNDFKRRKREHQRKAWWVEVDDTRTLVWNYRSEVEARAVESAAIKSERPRENVAQNPVARWAKRIPVPSVPVLPHRRRVERVEVGPPPGPVWWRDPSWEATVPGRGHYDWQGAE